MDNRSLGLFLVGIGTVFLILALTLHIAGLLYGVILGSSILLNVSGAGILMKFIADEKLANLQRSYKVRSLCYESYARMYLLEMFGGYPVLEMNFFWLALGLAALGYFIGDGLKNFSKPQRKSKYPYLIKEKDLHYHFHLSKGEIEELLTKYPGAPKIELKGTTYYPYHQFVDWLSSNEIYKV